MNQLGDESFYNPPAYYQNTAPNQIPLQTWPMQMTSYGPWYGFYLGQRTLTQSDAERIAREKQDYMERRAEVTEIPEHKYISAEGRLAPPIAAAYRAAEIEARRREHENSPFAQLKKKLMASALIGSVVNTLLK